MCACRGERMASVVWLDYVPPSISLFILPALFFLSLLTMANPPLLPSTHTQLTVQQLADRLLSANGQTSITFHDIRKVAAAYLRANPDEFVPFLDVPSEAEGDPAGICVCVCRGLWECRGVCV